MYTSKSTIPILSDSLPRAFITYPRPFRRSTSAEQEAIGFGPRTLLSRGALAVYPRCLCTANKSTKVVEFRAYLTVQGIENVAMTSQSEHRDRGSNKHLDGFLRTRNDGSASSAAPSSVVKEVPHVMVTTLILFRLLISSTFSSLTCHETRLIFLHGAGAAGHAGQHGKVIICGKLKGRSSWGDMKKRLLHSFLFCDLRSSSSHVIGLLRCSPLILLLVYALSPFK
jgi:hypothetical protein